MKFLSRNAFLLTAMLLCSILVSCTSTGEYMPLKESETVIGTVQTTFYVPSSFFFLNTVKESLNKNAYVRLMETAGHKYSGNIDIRDIVWVTGDKSSDNTKTEIFATGKVIQRD